MDNERSVVTGSQFMKSIASRWCRRAAFVALAAASSPIVPVPGSAQTAGVCDRTPAVRDALVAAIDGVTDCASVTAGHLAAVTSLNFYESGITALKDGDFDGLSGLTGLDLSKNQLTSMVDVSHLTTLTQLVLTDNRLTSVPDLSKLTALTGLWVNDNRLTSIPDLSRLTALKLLDMSGNRLTSPPDLSRNTALTHVDMSDNRLTSLPDLSRNTALSRIGAANNQLTSLPDLSRHTALRSVDVGGNPLSNLDGVVVTDDAGQPAVLHQATDTYYLAFVASDVAGVRVTPTATDDGVMPSGLASRLPPPKIGVGLQDGAATAVASGSASDLISVSEETTRLQVTVNGRAGGPKIYRITVRRTGSARQPPGQPEPPRVAPAANSKTSLVVTWTAPWNGHAPITGYDLRYRAGTSGSWSDGPRDVTGTSASIAGLQPRTAYQVQVRATNLKGDGEWSDPGTGRTSTSTSLPSANISAGTSTVTEGTSAIFTVSLSRAAPAGGARIGLIVSEAAGSDFVAAGDEGATSVTIPANATSTTFRVATVDDGDGEPNGSVTVALASVPAGYGLGTVRSASVAVLDNDGGGGNGGGGNGGNGGRKDQERKK